jgi:hypothetical protein
MPASSVSLECYKDLRTDFISGNPLPDLNEGGDHWSRAFRLSASNNEERAVMGCERRALTTSVGADTLCRGRLVMDASYAEAQRFVHRFSPLSVTKLVMVNCSIFTHAARTAARRWPTRAQ